MDNLVLNYFKAWETKDKLLLQEVLTPTPRGIRTFFEQRLYNLDAILEALEDSVVIKYSIIHQDVMDGVIYVDADLMYRENNVENNVMVTMKIIIDGGRIKRVYETRKLIGKKRIKCVVSYDGSTYLGYQKQKVGNTIQGTLEKVLSKICNEDISIHSSGRTDKGVHAHNQVFHFDTTSKINPHGFRLVLNSNLPDSIYIKSSEEVHGTFHSRFDIYYKEYVYMINTADYNMILRNYEWAPGKFDMDIFEYEIQSVVGEHDFTAFTKTNHLSNIRNVHSVQFEQVGIHLKVTIRGTGFLRYMVRNIVYAAISIANRSIMNSMGELIEKRDNTLIIDMAPAGGLYLNEVKYYD